MYTKFKNICVFIKNIINLIMNILMKFYNFLNIKLLHFVFFALIASYWGLLCVLGRFNSEVKTIFISIATSISKVYTWIPIMPNNTWYIFTYVLFLHIIWLIFVTIVNYRVYDTKTISYEFLIDKEESRLFKLFYIVVVVSFFFLLIATGLGHKIYCKVALSFGFFFFKAIKSIFFFDTTPGFIFIVLIIIFTPIAGLYSLEISNKVKEEYICELITFYCVAMPVTITVFLNTLFFPIFHKETVYIFLYATFLYIYSCGFNALVARLVRKYQIKVFDNFFLVGTLNFLTACIIICNLYFISLF